MSNPLFFDPLLNTAEEPDDSIFFPTKEVKEKSKAVGKKSLFGEDEEEDDITSALIEKKKKAASAQASPIVSPSGSPKPKVKTIEAKPLPSPSIDELDKRNQAQSLANRIDDPFETSLEVAGLNQPKKLLTFAKPLIGMTY